jgi:hypothetical protein
MLKILGTIDILTGLLLFIFLKFGTFRLGLVILLVLLILKSLATFKDLFSIIDLIASLIIVFALFGVVSNLTWFVFGWLVLKGLWSLVSSV